MQLNIQLGTQGMTLTSSSPGPPVLTPLEAGRLRAAIRDALLTLDRLHTDDPDSVHVPAGTHPPRDRPLGPTAPAAARRRIRITPPPRPSVAEIASRIALPAPPLMEISDDHDASAMHASPAESTATAA